MTFSSIAPYQYVAIRVTNDFTYIEQLKPNSLVNLGKYGSFHSNQILGRPYHVTFEILDRSEQHDDRELRIVPAAEVHAIALLEEAEDDSLDTPAESEEGGPPDTKKTNMNINDDPTNQRLTMSEIEALKQDDMGSTKELIAKIMQSHSTLDQKTAFSLAKYSLRKHKKYLKRFTVLPLDVATLTDWFMIQRDFSKIMEIRNETMALIGCWANIHHSGNIPSLDPAGRYLVVDDSGGLIAAAIAERMGILHQENLSEKEAATVSDENDIEADVVNPTSRPRHRQKDNLQMSATSNSLTVIHSNQQPNLSILRYFNFDHSNPTPSHPLYTHLRTLSWLQLLEPSSDPAYLEPEIISPETLSTMKSNRRSNYFRKRRRWERIKTVIDDTRCGGFNGLIVASHTSPLSILRHCVPLLSGGAQVVVYSPHIEQLTSLADAYSTARRTAFLSTVADGAERTMPTGDFPVDPTLLLVPTVQTSRVRKWQVLPGRTHPMMTSRGGAEGYVFVATRVLPVEGRVEARGRVGRRKKGRLGEDEGGQKEKEGVHVRNGDASEPDYAVNQENGLEGEDFQSKRLNEDQDAEAARSKKRRVDADDVLTALEHSLSEARGADDDVGMTASPALSDDSVGNIG